MKASELMEELYTGCCERINGKNDRLKFGDPDRETKKVATCFIPTPQLLWDAAEWGADLLITHEPSFAGRDDLTPDTVIDRASLDLATRRMLSVMDSAGMTVYRWHDHPHTGDIDRIHRGFIERTGITADCHTYDCVSFGVRRYPLSSPVSGKDIARAAHEKLGIAHPRFVGDGDYPAENVILALGSPGMIYDYMCANDTPSIIVCGECCEWRECEYVRDCVQMGEHKCIVVLGHCGSERDGMLLLAGDINRDYAAHGIEAKYFECGEVYNYLD